MKFLRIIGIASIFIFALGLLLSNPEGPLYTGQDAAGKGMFAGFVAVLFWIIAIIVAVIAFWKSFKSPVPLDRLTLVLARGPFILFAILFFIGFVFSITRG